MNLQTRNISKYWKNISKYFKEYFTLIGLSHSGCFHLSQGMQSTAKPRGYSNKYYQYFHRLAKYCGDPHNRSFPCMETIYSYATKNQRKARNTPKRGHFVLWAGSFWHKKAGINQSERSIRTDLSEWELSTDLWISRWRSRRSWWERRYLRSRGSPGWAPPRSSHRGPGSSCSPQNISVIRNISNLFSRMKIFHRNVRKGFY